MDDREKILSLIKIQSANNEDFKRFFEVLNLYMNVILIGGAARGALENDFNPRDLDFILNNDNMNDFESIIKNLHINYAKNSFGGYKLKFKNLEVDVWSIYTHNSFIKGFMEPSVENLEKTCVINYDAVLYDFKKNVLYDSIYQNCKKNKTIKLIGDLKMINSHGIGRNVARLIRKQLESGYKFDNRTIKYIEDYFKSNSKEDLYSAYQQHYKELPSKNFINSVNNFEKLVYNNYIKIN